MIRPSRVLFIAEGQLGDLLLLTPALRALKKTLPDSYISVLILERGSSETPRGLPLVRIGTETVLSTNLNVHETYVVSRAGLRSLRGLARVWAELNIVHFLRSKRFDTVVCTFPEDRFTLWAFASAADVRVGEKRQGFTGLLTHALSIHKSERGVLEYYCDLVRALGVSVELTETEYIIPSSALEWADSFLRESGLEKSRFVAVHPGASGDYKIWPPERYSELIDRLQSTTDIRVLLCRGSQDDEIIAAIRACLKSAVIEAKPESIGNLAALLKRSALCISNDSGPRHLAVAVGTPSLSFFRQHHSREWRIYPDSPRCVTLESRERCPVCPSGECLDRIPTGERFGSHCLRDIPTETVTKTAMDLLASL